MSKLREVVVYANQAKRDAPKMIPDYAGLFHGWSHRGMTVGEVYDTHALVEKDDGRIMLVDPCCIKFLKPLVE